MARSNEYYRNYYKNNRVRILEVHKKSNKKNKKHINSYKRKWAKTLAGKLLSLIGMIRRRCNHPDAHNFKYYGGRGIKCLLTKADLLFLWRRDNAQNLRKPSIDRINNDGPYARDNCRFIELSANVAKQWTDRKESLARQRNEDVS